MSEQMSPAKENHKYNENKEFSLLKKIGKGSFAVVYKATLNTPVASKNGSNFDTGDTIAVKIVQMSKLKREKRVLNSFLGEMEIMKELHHKHIVNLIDVVKDNKRYNLLMEYCDLGDLSYFIRHRDTLGARSPYLHSLMLCYPNTKYGLNADIIRAFLAQLASALKFLKDHDILHRDLKPQNILLSQPSSTDGYGSEKGLNALPVVKVADFGFAKILPEASMTDTLCGSPLYMAPEILRYERYDARADLWSIGAVAYEMVTGKPPFNASNHIELLKVIDAAKDNIVFPDLVDTDIRVIIRELLVRNQNQRMEFTKFYTSCMKLTDKIEHASRPNSAAMEPHTFAQASDFGRESMSLSPKSTYTGIKAASKAPEQENDFVVVEKKAVEVNSLADNLENPNWASPQGNQAPTSARRRLSSIVYGASPTNAMAQAILRSSSRLFASRMEPSSATSSERAETTQKLNDCTNHIINDLERLSTMAKVVVAYGDIKFSQLVVQGEDLGLSILSILNSRYEHEAQPLDAQTTYNPTEQLEIATDALALHMKTLSILQLAMQKFSSWWDQQNCAKSNHQKESEGTPKIKKLVQWIRSKYNSTFKRAETEKKIVEKLCVELDRAPKFANAERLLFERALSLSKIAGETEKTMLDDLEPHESIGSERRSICFVNYSTSLWLLNAFLEANDSHSSHDDKALVNELKSRIITRLSHFSSMESSQAIDGLSINGTDSVFSDSSSSQLFPLDD